MGSGIGAGEYEGREDDGGAVRDRFTPPPQQPVVCTRLYWLRFGTSARLCLKSLTSLGSAASSFSISFSSLWPRP